MSCTPLQHLQKVYQYTHIDFVYIYVFAIYFIILLLLISDCSTFVSWILHWAATGTYLILLSSGMSSRFREDRNIVVGAAKDSLLAIAYHYFCHCHYWKREYLVSNLVWQYFVRLCPQEGPGLWTRPPYCVQLCTAVYLSPPLNCLLLLAISRQAKTSWCRPLIMPTTSTYAT